MVLLVVGEQHRQPLFVFLPGEHLNDVLIAPHAPAVNLPHGLKSHMSTCCPSTASTNPAENPSGSSGSV